MPKSTNLPIAISHLIVKHPFFATLLMTLLKMEETGRIPTLAVDEDTIYINPEFFDKHTILEGVFMLAHEILHAVFTHPHRAKVYVDRGEGPDHKPFSPLKWNVAADYVINSLLKSAKVGATPSGVLLSPAVHGEDLVDKVYCTIKSPPSKSGKAGESPNSGGHGGFDTHLPPKPSGESLSKAAVNRAIRQAVNTSKARGVKLPSAIRAIVNELLEPKVNWREALRQFMVDVNGRDESTWSRVHRRRISTPPHIPLPGTKGSRVGCVGIIIDTSGSIGANELQMFLSEVSGLLGDFPPEQCVLFWTHETVYATNEVDETTDLLRDVSPPQSGGTDMEAGLTYALDYMPDMDVAIVLTDGYTSFSHNPPVNIPTLWVMTTTQVAPYGQTIHLEE